MLQPEKRTWGRTMRAELHKAQPERYMNTSTL